MYNAFTCKFTLINSQNKISNSKLNEPHCLSLLISKSDQHLISPYIITPESHIKIMRIKEMITNYRSLWFLNKFSLSAGKKCTEKSVENMNTDVRVWRINSVIGLENLQHFLKVRREKNQNKGCQVTLFPSVDLFILYALFTHFRSFDNTLKKCFFQIFLTRMHIYA